MRIQTEGTELTPEQIELFSETFKLFDKDGSGTIDVQEFRSVCETIGMRPTDTELQLMLMDVDKDNSGDIDLQEFIEAMRTKYVDNEGPEVAARPGRYASLRQLMKSAFEIFDTDGSGTLSYEEMTDVLMNLGQDMDHTTVWLHDVDQNGEIDLDEFMAVCQGRLFM